MPKKVLTPQSPDSLASIASRLTEIASGIAAYGHVMKELAIESLDVSGYDSITKALKFAKVFKDAVEDGINEARENRGDYLASKRQVKKGQK